MSAPVGPTGCEGGEHGEVAGGRWFVSASYGRFASDLRFSGNIEPAIAEQMVVAAAGRRLGQAFSVRLAAGAILDGTLEVAGEDHDVGIGYLVSASIARRISFGTGDRFFAIATISAGVSSTSTQAMGATDSVGLTAGDVRAGVIAGAMLWQRVSPYVLVRGFGGPVFWNFGGQDITGSDQYHYQVGGGLSVNLRTGWSALVDASVVGERSLSISAGYSL